MIQGKRNFSILPEQWFGEEDEECLGEDVTPYELLD